MRRWINIADPGDFIAIPRGLAPYFDGIDTDLTTPIGVRTTPTANMDDNRPARFGELKLCRLIPGACVRGPRFLSVSGCSVMFVGVRQLIPEGLAGIVPGPELARVLAGLELSRLSGFDGVEVLKAQYRQANHERARVMAAMAQVGVCGPVPDDDLTRRVLPDEFSADEVRAALVLTRRAAHSQFWLAYDLVTRLPQVHAAMEAGILDEPRARVFSEWTIELSPEQARAVCAELLGRAPGVDHRAVGRADQEAGHRRGSGLAAPRGALLYPL